MRAVRAVLVGAFLFQTAGGMVIPSENSSTSIDPRISSIAASATSSASLRPYAQPSAKIEQVLALGDSFTAGIGSNGLRQQLRGSGDCLRFAKAWPEQLSTLEGWEDFNKDAPALTFGACSGATMNNQPGLDKKGLNQNQLKQGQPKPNLPNTPIGKPQIAVLTITGNDVGFSE